MKPHRSTKGRGRKPAARSPYRALIALGLVAGLGLLYGWNMVFLAPQGRQRTEVQGKLASARKQGDDLRAQLAQLKKVAADTQSREAELARLGRLVPAEPDVAGAILTLNDTANLAQVTMSSFVPAPAAPSAGGGPVTMGISMKISGTFPQVFDYLVRLESLDRLVVVDSLQLTGGPQPNGPSKVDADVRGRMFAAGTGAAAAPAATTVSTSTPAPAASDSTTKSVGTAATAAAVTKAGG